MVLEISIIEKLLNYIGRLINGCHGDDQNEKDAQKIGEEIEQQIERGTKQTEFDYRNNNDDEAIDSSKSNSDSDSER